MANRSRNAPIVGSYLKFILGSPVASWWALFTGVIDIVAFGLVKDTMELSKWWLLAAISIASFCLLVGVLVLWKAWPLYAQTYERITLSDIVRVDGRRIFLLDGLHHLKVGSMLEIYRTREGVEVPIGFVRISHQREDGVTQAETVWIMPGHLRDMETGNLSVQNLKFHRILSQDTLERWVDDRAERKLQDLIRRGTE
jgi:hypothetical protein